MVAVVADDVVAASYDHGQHSSVHGETGREAQCLVLVYKFGKLLLKLYVEVERSVEEPAASTSRTVLVQCSLGCINNTLVASKTSVSI